MIIAARDETSGRRVAADVTASGGKATFLLLDVSKSESVRHAARQFATIADHLDVLVNNAAVYPD